MNSKITVIIPNFNRAHVILDALESVRNQTYSNWECIIIDDGSKDESESKIKVFIEKDNRFKFIQRPFNRIKGASTCRNIGLETASGKFIQFLDSDDVIALNKFEIQLNQLKNEPLGTIATCRFGIFRPSTKEPKTYKGLKTYRNFKNPLDLLESFAKNFTYFPLHSYLIPKSVADNVGKWNELLTVNDDGEYFTRIILNSTKICFCNKTFVLYKTGAGDRVSKKASSANGEQSYIQSWNLIEQYIYSKTGIKNHLYVKYAKANMHEWLLQENKPFIEKYKVFLDGRWQNPNYLIFKSLNKLRYRLFVSSVEE